MTGTSVPAGRESLLLEAFVRMADTLVDDYDVSEVLTELTAYCVELLGAEAAGLVLADQRGELALAASSVEQTRLLELFQILAKEGPCLDCFRTGEPVLIDDLAEYRDRWPEFVPVALHQGFRSVHSVPLRLRRDVIGALNLFGTDPGAPDDQDLDVARALADTATIGILQERSIRRGEVITQQLQHALDSRIIIEQAKGILAQASNRDIAECFEDLRAHARNNNMRLSELARRIVDGTVPAGDLVGGHHGAPGPLGSR